MLNFDAMRRIPVKRVFQSASLMVLGGLLLAGCVTDTLRDSVHEGKLKDTLRLYESTVRWGALERMYGFLRPADRENIQIPAGLDNVRVMSYEAALAPVRIDENRYQHTAAIKYVLQDRQVVKTVIDQQVWERDPEANKWYRVNPIPPLE